MRSGFRLSCVWVSIQLVSVVSAATIKSTCGMVKFKPAKSENEEALCAISPSPTAATSMKTKVQCSWACAHSGDTCAAGFNFKEQQALCEMFANPPTTLEVQQDCEYYTVAGTDTAVLEQTSDVIPNCSFPFTYNGALHYSCIADMTDVSTEDQPYACINVNATPVVYESPDFVAEISTINIPFASQVHPLPIKSVFGWIIINQRLGYTFDWQLNWADYKTKFGSIDADFWLGLETMHLLTSSQPYRLRVEVEDRSTNLWYSAEYWSFKIGDEPNDKYRLDVAGFSGDAGDSLQYEGDYGGNGNVGGYYHNGMKFSTKDQDNDLGSGNCATGRGGGWWYNSCMWSCLTCYQSKYEWWTEPVGFVVNSRMMIKPQ